MRKLPQNLLPHEGGGGRKFGKDKREKKDCWVGAERLKGVEGIR